MRIEGLDEIRSATAGMHAAQVAAVKVLEGGASHDDLATFCGNCGKPAEFIDHYQDAEEWQSCAHCGACSDVGDPESVYYA